jgi:CRISPR-associated protein Csx10
MKHYQLTAALLSPLVVRKERQSQRSEGVQSISGTLLRGALAEVWLQQHGRPDDTFQRLFLNERACRFGPLDPARHVLPLSAASCKRFPGFRDDGKHGMADDLWARMAQRLAGKVSPDPNRCHCKNDLKGVSGFWEKVGKTWSQPQHRWRQSVTAHVGIDRHTHTAAESIFYTLPALEPQTGKDGEEAVLVGTVEGGPEEIVLLRDLLATEQGVMHVGHARTRGYGRVRLEIGPEPLAEDTGDWEDWSQELIRYLGQSGLKFPDLSSDRQFLFSLSLPDGAVLVDQVLRYTLDLNGMVGWLPPLPRPDVATPVITQNPEGWQLDGDRIWCVHAVARHERLRGWNAAHGLPRQDEWAVSRGSVYAYLFEGAQGTREALKVRLAGLQRDGVGARRNEGFGRVVVSDSFHRDLREQEKAP